MTAAIFPFFIGLLSLVILAVCAVAIVMSTTHGSAWLQSTWRRAARTPQNSDPDETQTVLSTSREPR